MIRSAITHQTIEELLPEFEAAVYDPLVEMLFGEVDSGPELDLARTHIARLPYCREAAEAGRSFLAARLGYFAVRHEVHALPDEKHHFLTVMTHPQRITDADTVIDPTYLQYAQEPDLSVLAGRHPRVFVGARAAIIDLMYTEDFKGEDAAVLYTPQTLELIT